MTDSRPTPDSPRPPAAARVRAAAEVAAAALPPAMQVDGVVDMFVQTLENEEFRRRFIAEPAAAAASVGVEFDVPEGVSIVVHERSADTVHIVLPGGIVERSADQELTDDQIRTSSGNRVLLGDMFNNSKDRKTVDAKPAPDGPNADIDDLTGRGNTDSSSNIDENRIDE